MRAKLRILTVLLREGTVVRRVCPRSYMNGILAILRAKRTGTLLVDGWRLKDTLWWCGGRKPVYISLEDVRTFEDEDPPDRDPAIGKERAAAITALNRDRKRALEQAWLPRS